MSPIRPHRPLLVLIAAALLLAACSSPESSAPKDTPSQSKTKSQADLSGLLALLEETEWRFWGVDETAEAFGVRQANRLNELESALTAGEPSPDGTYRAAMVSGSGPFENWLYIQRPNKAPLRVDGFDGILDYQWLDNSRLVYTTNQWGVISHGFYVVDVAKEKVAVKAWAPAGVTAFGVVDPNHIWYETSRGQRGELPLDGSAQPPELAPIAPTTNQGTPGPTTPSRMSPRS